MEKKKTVLLIVISLLISLAITLAAVYCYKNLNLSDTGNRFIQNTAYTLMLLGTFLFIRFSKRTLREFGLFKEHLLKQIVVGVIIAGIFLVLFAITGWRPYLKENLLYLALSQLLVAFTEELLFRGFVLTMLKNLVSTTNKAVFLSAVLFGLWHYPIGQSIGQVTTTFFIGLIWGTLRTIYQDTEDEISVLSLSMVHWVFNVIV
ncbi:MAG: CPBP family intramembrane metalloprotease [Roseburia sp.]|nr:CPBP family intramembrane metalloprotease [Roseburia sp.]